MQLCTSPALLSDPNQLVALHELFEKERPALFDPDTRNPASIVAQGAYIDALSRCGQTQKAEARATEFVKAYLSQALISSVSDYSGERLMMSELNHHAQARQKMSSVLYFLGTRRDVEAVSYFLTAVGFDAGNWKAWQELQYRLSRSDVSELVGKIDWEGHGDMQAAVFQISSIVSDDMELERVSLSIDPLIPCTTQVQQVIRSYITCNRIEECMHFLLKFPENSLLFKSLEILPILSVVLYKAGRKDILFRLASYFMPRYGTEAFFVTGAYYMSIGRYDIARKFLSKVTSSETCRGPWGWLAYGVAFSYSDESSHALSAYRKATVLFPHLPVSWIYMGQEYIRTNELKLAQSYLVTALNLADTDPVNAQLYRRIILNEIGVICLKAQQFDVCVENFKLCCDERITDENLSAYFANLGYGFIKTREFDSAIRAFENAVSRNRGNANAAAGLGYSHHSKGSIGKAIDMYNMALHALQGSNNKKLENVLNNLIHIAVSEYAFSIKQNYLSTSVGPIQEHEAMVTSF